MDKEKVVYIFNGILFTLGTRGMGTWHRLADLKGEAGGVDWMKEGEENTKKHIYITHGYRHRCGKGQKDGKGRE